MLDDLNEEKLLKHFLELKDLFSNEKKISKTELEGMFGELFAMYVLKINYNFYVEYQKLKYEFNKKYEYIDFDELYSLDRIKEVSLKEEK